MNAKRGLPEASREKCPCVGHRVDVPAEVLAQRLGGVAVVVEMKLDLAEAKLCEVAERVEPARPILLARKEERVTRVVAVGVDEVFGEARVRLRPEAHAGVAHGVADLVPERLVVVADREDAGALSAEGRRAPAVEEKTPVAPGPGVNVLVAEVAGEASHRG